nr:hypothetical protein Itr_chr08CG15810 [Ipomoea trifida]
MPTTLTSPSPSHAALVSFFSYHPLRPTLALEEGGTVKTLAGSNDGGLGLVDGNYLLAGTADVGGDMRIPQPSLPRCSPSSAMVGCSSSAGLFPSLFLVATTATTLQLRSNIGHLAAVSERLRLSSIDEDQLQDGDCSPPTAKRRSRQRQLDVAAA